VCQVKEEAGVFKNVKLSANEFEWQVGVADERRHEEIRKEYD
jgi:hypothetical protein